MVKQLPLQSGHIYHIYTRGNNSENIFIQERNFHYFWNLYEQKLSPIFETYAFCLLRNHFHLLVRVIDSSESQPDLVSTCSPSRAFGNFLNAYAKGINAAYGRTGSLLEKPFRRIKVHSIGYFRNLVVYIHQNPQKHGFVDDFRSWPYSSFRTLVSQKTSRLKRDEVLRWIGDTEDFHSCHKELLPASRIFPLSLEE